MYNYFTDENPNVPLLRSQSASRPPRSRGNSGASRHAPPQAPQSNSRARRERPADTAAGPAVREEGVARGGEFNMTKYIMVCTGSGRWYCKLHWTLCIMECKVHACCVYLQVAAVCCSVGGYWD